MRRVRVNVPYQPLLPDSVEPEPITLNPDQKRALDSIISAIGRHQTFLLHGVTGSGKTEISETSLSSC